MRRIVGVVALAGASTVSSRAIAADAPEADLHLEAADEKGGVTFMVSGTEVHETIVLVKRPASAAESIQLLVTDVGPIIDGEHPALKVVGDSPDGGAPPAVATFTIGPNSGAVVRLAGTGFRRETVYHATLIARGEQLFRTFPLTIRGTSSPIPVGIRSNEWSDVVPLPILSSAVSAQTCIPANASLGSNAAVRIAMEAPNPVRPDNVRALPPGMTAARCEGGVQLQTGQLSAGRYSQNVKVEGEAVAIQLIVRVSLWLIVGGLLFGAAVSWCLRALVRVAGANADAQSLIDAYLREARTYVLAIDERSASCAVSRARGYNAALLRDLVQGELDKARVVPVVRPEFDIVVSALTRASLPESIRSRVQRELEDLTRVSSLKDRAAVMRSLTALSREAEADFATRLDAWLVGLRRRIAVTEQSLRHPPYSGVLSDLMETVFNTLEQVVEDAQLLQLVGRQTNKRSEISKPHVAFLELVVPFLESLSRISKDGAAKKFETALTDACFLVLPSASEVPVPTSIILPKWGIQVVQDPLSPATGPQAMDLVTFGISGISDVSLESQRIVWTISESGRNPISIDGGARLTHLFPRHGEAKVAARLTLRGQGADSGGTKELNVEIGKYRDELRNARLTAWLSQQGLTIFGVLAGMVVAALYAADRPFGSGGDFLGLFLAGVGIDVGTNATSALSAIRGWWKNGRTT